ALCKWQDVPSPVKFLCDRQYFVNGREDTAPIPHVALDLHAKSRLRHATFPAWLREGAPPGCVSLTLTCKGERNPSILICTTAATCPPGTTAGEALFVGFPNDRQLRMSDGRQAPVGMRLTRWAVDDRQGGCRARESGPRTGETRC